MNFETKDPWISNRDLMPPTIFELFFDDVTYELIKDMTNLYARQKGLTFDVTTGELKTVFGIMFISCLGNSEQLG